MELNCEMTESVVFYSVNQIHTSISSWIITTAIDFNPYRNGLSNENKYAIKSKQSLVEYSDSFQSSDQMYDHLLNITLKDLDSVLNEIPPHKLKPLIWLTILKSPGPPETKDSSFLLVDYSISYMAQQIMKNLIQWNKTFKDFTTIKLDSLKC